MDSTKKKLIILALIILTLVVWKTCKDIDKPLPSFYSNATDTIVIKENNVKENMLRYDSLTHVIDSLKLVKGKVVIRYKTKYDSIYIVNDSACRVALNEVNKQCMILDSTNNVIIDNQESSLVTLVNVVGEQSDIIKLQKFKASKDSIDSAIKLEELKVSNKRKVFKVASISAIGGLLIGLIIR
jgi:hypothetical protein